MTAWLCILTPENYEVVEKKLIWGVEDRHEKKIQQVKKGDKLIMYVTGDKKIKGIFEATGKPYKEKKQIFKGGVYPNRVKLKKVKTGDLEISKVLEKLELFKGAGKFWGMRLLGKAMIEISDKDYKTIDRNI